MVCDDILSELLNTLSEKTGDKAKYFFSEPKIYELKKEIYNILDKYKDFIRGNFEISKKYEDKIKLNYRINKIKGLENSNINNKVYENTIDILVYCLVKG